MLLLYQQLPSLPGNPQQKKGNGQPKGVLVSSHTAMHAAQEYGLCFVLEERVCVICRG